ALIGFFPALLCLDVDSSYTLIIPKCCTYLLNWGAEITALTPPQNGWSSLGGLVSNFICGNLVKF
ncbi:MAG: hypothetical protein WC523_06950, partial [Patescibacteria group bacterium]